MYDFRFFVTGADQLREKAWEMMKDRADVMFMIPTKRPERVTESLPNWWDTGLENVWLNVSTENQEMADKRIPVLLKLPFKHKGIMASPLIEDIDIQQYLDTKQIDEVCAAGENYTGAREFKFEWAQSLQRQCRQANTSFRLFETGSNFWYNGKTYNIPIQQQKQQAKLANIDYQGRDIQLILNSTDNQEKLF